MISYESLRNGSFYQVDLGMHSLNPKSYIFKAILFIKSQHYCSIALFIFNFTIISRRWHFFNVKFSQTYSMKGTRRLNG
jgi:hypothetical protein